MRINNIGYNHTHDADLIINRPDGSGDNLLLLLKTGAIFDLGEGEIITQPNSFIFYKRGTPQYYKSDGGAFSNDWFHFDTDEEDRDFFDSLDIPTDKVINIGSLHSLSLLVKNMCYEHYSSNLFRTDSEALYLKLFFLKLSETLHRITLSGDASYYDKLTLLRTKIYSMPFNEWSVNWLAHELALSKSYFQHLYKDYFGVSVMSDVINSRIEHGKYLLATTDISVKQIAQMCGYNNENHFMRQFREHEGQTPTEYRIQSKNLK